MAAPDATPSDAATSGTPPVIVALAIDCADPPGLARWWSRLLGGEVELAADGDAGLCTPQGVVIDFLRVPDPKTVKNRLHLDLRGADLEAATARAIALGATRAEDVYAGDRWHVLRDPEGNEFCILRPVADPER